ncbi:MAG TPA: hypothetical protein VJM81_05970 [Rhizorhapis sp.]|nr:hypothetical protein [Rhizorhapis sp.]
MAVERNRSRAGEHAPGPQSSYGKKGPKPRDDEQDQAEERAELEDAKPGTDSAMTEQGNADDINRKDTQNVHGQ